MDESIPTDDFNRLQTCMQQVADFIALSEEAVQKLEKHDTITGEMLEKSSVHFDQQLEQIRGALGDLQSFMTQAGVARLRVSAEHMLTDGQEHLQNIKEATEQFKHVAENSCSNLQRASENSADWIAEAIKSLQIEKFRNLVFENVDRIENSADTAIRRIQKLSKWFQWEKLGIALVVAVLVSLLTGLFINDEMPWETHNKVVMARNVGKMLIQAWPKLSASEKEHIQALSSSEYI